jgi:hypothetical protein
MGGSPGRETYPPLSTHMSVFFVLWNFHIRESRRTSNTLKYLSRYYAATTAVYARRRLHRGFFGLVSVLFSQKGNVSPVFNSLLFPFKHLLLPRKVIVQMVCIIQTQPTPRLLQLLRRQSFQ